jgi:hypothetical protein
VKTFLGWTYITELGCSTNVGLTRALLGQALWNVQRGKPCGETLASAVLPVRLPNGSADIPEHLAALNPADVIQRELVQVLRGAVERGVQIGRPELRLSRANERKREQSVGWCETADPLDGFSEDERHTVAAVLAYLESKFPAARVSLAFRHGTLQAFAVEIEDEVLPLAVADEVWGLPPAVLTHRLERWDVAGDMRRSAPRVVVVRPKHIEVRDQRQIPLF